MLLKPEEAVRGWIGRHAASYGGTQTITQAFGARDLVLGAGTLAALLSGKDARDWVIAGGLCDCVDLASTVAQDEIPVSGKIIVGLLATQAIAVSAGYVLAGSNE